MIEDLLMAMRAMHLPAPQDSGLWYIERRDVSMIGWYGHFDRHPTIAPTLTSLVRWTDETLHLGRGESVMSDDPKELKRHLPIVLKASGRVLVSGLGLGCVVRGLLARPAVERIDVVESSEDVLRMVAPSFNGEPRLVIHKGDALTCEWSPGTSWDYAWHDVWSEHTQVDHARLLVKYKNLVRVQGAWMFPRALKRRVTIPLVDNGRSAKTHRAARA